MLYPTLNQPILFIVLIAGGVVGGLIFDVFRILSTLSGNDRFSKHFFDFLATLFTFFLLFFINMGLNYGQFRIYVPLVFLTSFTLERLFSKFLWTKLLSKWYSSITRRKGRGGRKKEKTS